MRRTAIMVGVSLALLAFMPMMAPQVSAAAAGQILWAGTLLSSDAVILVEDGASQTDALNPVNRTPGAWPASDYGLDDNFWDETPGCVLWGDSSSATVGSFGTAEVRFTLTDMIGEIAPYYEITVLPLVTITLGEPVSGITFIDLGAVGTPYVSYRAGFGYVDADTGTAEFINETYNHITSGVGSPWQTSGTSTDNFTEDQRNTLYDRPFTASEINNMYIVLQLRYDPQVYGYVDVYAPSPMNFGVAYINIRVDPVEYTPTPPPEGRFILRPDADRYTTGFTNYSVDDYEGMYGALNDTTQHGDAEQSFINATWSKSAFVGLAFTDPPAWAPDIDYRVTLWSIIRQTVITPGAFYTLTMSISSDGVDQKVYYPSTSYTNNTHESLYIPGSADFWSLTDLEDIQANIWLNWVGSTPDGEMRVTQMAFLCSPIIPDDYVPDVDEFTDESFQGWIAAGGLATIFGLMGGIGLIAGAPLAIIFFKSGRADGAGALAIAVGVIFISLSFLLVGLGAYA